MLAGRVDLHIPSPLGSNVDQVCVQVRPMDVAGETIVRARKALIVDLGQLRGMEQVRWRARRKLWRVRLGEERLGRRAGRVC